MLYTLAKKVYNIENDVIHFGPESVKCITSKTMLYTLALKVYNIENDIIQHWHPSVFNQEVTNTIRACITTVK